jgi:hypothetical protein
MFIVFFLLGVVGWGKPVWHQAIPWPAALRLSFVVSTVTAVSVFLFQAIYGWRFTNDRVMICSICGRMHPFSKKKSCGCGGVFEELDSFKWEEGIDGDRKDA